MTDKTFIPKANDVVKTSDGFYYRVEKSDTVNKCFRVTNFETGEQEYYSFSEVVELYDGSDESKTSAKKSIQKDKYKEAFELLAYEIFYRTALERKNGTPLHSGFSAARTLLVTVACDFDLPFQKIRSDAEKNFL